MVFLTDAWFTLFSPSDFLMEENQLVNPADVWLESVKEGLI